jgi:hypothetical protein
VGVAANSSSMNRRLLPLALALVAFSLPQAGNALPLGPDARSALQTGPGPGGFMSDNVTWAGYLPLESPAVSGRVVKVGDQTRFYVSNMKGLTIYDVTSPAAPVVLGRLVLPHSQNEDMDVSADGKRAIISADGCLLVCFEASPGIHVIDTSDPANPVKVGFHSEGHHTSTCADLACSVLYGSEGSTFVISPDGRTVTKAPVGWRTYINSADQTTKCAIGSDGAHDMNRDASGLISIDATPRCIVDPRQDPLQPVVVNRSTVPASKQLAYQHNSFRPRAGSWVPRDPTAPDYADPALRPGEMLIGNGETNLAPRCNGSNNGPIATWSMRNFDQGQAMQVLKVFRPSVNGNYADGNPAVNVLGCSGHYFEERDNILAAAWFEHGTRFIKVNPTNGEMQEVGFFQPVVGSAGAAYWINDEYVYVTDYERGVDILRFDRTAPPPTAADISASWLAGLDKAPSDVGQAEQYACRRSTRTLTVG